MSEKTVPTRTDRQPMAEREPTRESEMYLAPPVDIYETQDGLTVVADLPGVDKDDLVINVDNGRLTIQGQTNHLAAGDPVWAEYRLMSFYRQFELPDEIDQEKIGAELKHGVLTLTLPRAEKAKPKQIQVSVK